ncbi:MAG: hypothetical protein FJX72_18560, partial [Armatimonadetes bacterium]|nr:hypothetical protein [Armatimonadota bacterium]
MMSGCVLALDLGTTAFKAAAVDSSGEVGAVTLAPCRLDHDSDGVTCDARRYARWAMRALAGACADARPRG